MSLVIRAPFPRQQIPTAVGIDIFPQLHSLATASNIEPLSTSADLANEESFSFESRPRLHESPSEGFSVC
jgi:hypothetical protein